MDCTSPVLGIYACGKCNNCRARSRQEWVFRLRMEYQSCNFGLFVTLTYDDDKLPLDGVCIRDVQLFLKRLRKHFNSKALRYYICSEYGDHTHRAHYHGLLFFNIDRSTDIYDIITDSWNNGFVQFGEIEEGSIVYCTKYCLKGSDVPPGQNQNFRLLSKMNGGVGIDYVEQQTAYHLSRITEPTLCHLRGEHAPMPRYYREKLLKNNFSEDEIHQIRHEYQEIVRNRRDDKFIRNYISWCKKHNYDLFPYFWAYKKLYYDYLFAIDERKSELIIKHTKKQNRL